MTGPLPAFPVPVFAAAVLLALAAAARRADGAGWLAVLILACAVQAAVVAATQHYGVASLRPVQPVTAAAIPPLAWLAFHRTARDARLVATDLGHAAPPILMAVVAATAPPALAAALPATFIGYGTAMLLSLRAGDAATPRLPLATGRRPGRLWILVAAALVGSGLSDVAITTAAASGHAALAPWIVTFGSTMTLLLVGWVAVSRDLRPDPATGPDRPAPPADDPEDAAIVARLDRLLDDTDLHLDPDLSLARLARRMGLPAKRLSAAVNRATGQNVSRHVNARRVAAARDRLAAGDSVTEAWLASGFATRSNFNREFKRVTGTTPRDVGHDASRSQHRRS